MTVTLAFVLMRLADACLGDHRRDWALAMQVEFGFALEDGKPLRFAAGCFLSALRELSLHAEGRLAIASHCIAISLLPVAALLSVGAFSGYPFLPLGQAGIWGLIAGDAERLQLLTPWTRGFAPPLLLLIIGLSVGHVLMAWSVVERNWSRVGTLARVNGAATATLFLFTFVLFLDPGFMLLPGLALAIELLAIWRLHDWETHSVGEVVRGTPTD